MKLLLSPCRVAVLTILLLSSQVSDAQFLTDMMDTTTEVGKGLLSIYKKFDRVQMSGYLQPQFQATNKKGLENFGGGNFAAQSNNRFMLRRGRLRFDYVRLNEKDQPSIHFVFQMDGSERGFAIRDFWGRYFENKWQLFSFTAGMFARPFGYELNLGSPDRESPERGRMSQILMKTERDLGVMATFEPRRKDHPLRYFKLDIGVFNGQGLSGPGEYDSYKDLISRLTFKPFPLSKSVTISGGLSFLQGGFIQNNKYVYNTRTNSGIKNFVVDSADNNLYAEAPRHYRGADLQLKIKNKWGFTELRGEYWYGTQTATATDTETPGLLQSTPYYIRKFNGAFFYFLQNIINKKHQIGLKYDWYDPNTAVSGTEIGKGGNNINAANIRYDTWGFGYNYFIDDHLKLTLWYDIINNEKTSLTDYARNHAYTMLTSRLQFRF